MKFLFIGTSRHFGGAEMHFVAMVRTLLAAGHTVDAVVLPGGSIARALEGSGARLHAGRFRNLLDLRGYRGAMGAARASRPDVLVGGFAKEYWPVLLLGRWLRLPVVLFRHRILPMRRLSAWIVPRLADRFFAMSRYARDAHVREGIPAERVQVLYNPVDVAALRPDPLRRAELMRSLGFDEDAIVVGYVGRMYFTKGIFVLLDALQGAMEQEPRLRCLWLGDGPGLPELRERIAAGSHADRHRVLGWIDDATPYYSVMAMLAFPSTLAEAFGRASAEAQAAGVPVLVADLGGAVETLDPGRTGLLLPPGDADALREGILRLCDPAVRDPMAAAASDFVASSFGSEAIAQEFVRAIKASVRPGAGG